MWLAVLALAGGCERDESIVFETVELAEGEFAGINWGGTQEERFYVVARKGTSGRRDDEAVIISPQHEKPCSLGVVARASAQQPQTGSKFVVGSPSPTRIAVFDNLDEGGFGRFGFVDVNCKRTDLEIEDVDDADPMRLYMPDLSSVLYGLRHRNGEYLLVDPWSEEITNFTLNGALVGSTNDGVWLLEDGQAVKRDFTGRELRRRGTEITSMWILGGVDGDDIGYVESGRLMVERAGKTEMLSRDGCELNTLDGFIPGALGFRSPCNNGEVVVAPVNGKQLRYENARGYLGRRGQLIIVRVLPDSLSVYTAFSGTPDQLVKWFELPAGTDVQDIWPVAGSWLVRTERDKRVDLLRIADRVPAGTPTVVASDLLAIGSGRGSGYLAWLKANGEVTFADRNAAGIMHRASGVRSFRVLFERRAQGLTYITNFDEETGLGRLTLHLASGETFRIADDVREYREVWWPERGILYAQGGETPGIRFARIDLPCEMTSDSPWACGF